MKHDHMVYTDWCDALINSPKRPLTDWESHFVESIWDQLDRAGAISERQAEILERIYAEKT